MRKITVNCDVCRESVVLEHAKEALFETGRNTYTLLDLCPRCLDGQLSEAESINDTRGYRQRAAVLLKLPGSSVPTPR
jgi:hypothetical protein